MHIVRTTRETTRAVAHARLRGKRIGLVPTMGALHAGHLSLVEVARRHSDFVVVSIFVNPTQFGPREDYRRYPRDLTRDARLLRRQGADLIFAPGPGTMYPAGYRTFVEVQGWSQILCGASRPGHFRGVATVVLKLFNIVQPDIAVFGRKDFQQVRVIERMVRDLNLGLCVVKAPIIRESNGLAMSSRNEYLTPRQRADAAILHQTLLWARREVRRKGAVRLSRLRDRMAKMISGAGGRTDYISVVDPDTLETQSVCRPGHVALLAVFFGSTRLIDNQSL